MSASTSSPSIPRALSETRRSPASRHRRSQVGKRKDSSLLILAVPKIRNEDEGKTRLLMEELAKSREEVTKLIKQRDEALVIALPDDFPS